MRFMLMVMLKGDESAAVVHRAEAVAKMTEYNTALQKAGILLALDELTAPGTAARISYAAGKATVIDGPFADASNVVAGYRVIQVRSREEAIGAARAAAPADA